MKQDLIIVGAGGSSQEIAEAVEQLNQERPTWNLLGFLDDDPAKLGEERAGYPVLGDVASAGRFSSALFVVGVANVDTPMARRDIVARLALPPERFATLIHPTSRVSRHVRVGRGSALLQHVVAPHGTTIGNHVLVQPLSSIGHDVVLEDYVTVAPAAAIAGFVRVRAGAYIGSNASILARLTIGSGAVVGIGAVVLTDVEPQTTVVGNPARKLPRLR